MAKQFLGQIRPLYKGEYDAEVANKLLDLVLYEGELYVCIASDGISTPIENKEFFKLVIPRGLPGITADHEWQGTMLMSDGREVADLRGPKGAKGQPGMDGAAGQNGAAGSNGACGLSEPSDHQWRLSRGAGNRNGHAAAWKIAELRIGNASANLWGPWRNVAGYSGNAT